MYYPQPRKVSEQKLIVLKFDQTLTILALFIENLWTELREKRVTAGFGQQLHFKKNQQQRLT